jgi:hypothetical protein
MWNLDLFLTMNDTGVKQGLLLGGNQWEVGGWKDRVKEEVEYDQSTFIHI